EAYCARLALIDHCCRWVGKETTSEDVDVVSIQSAWTLIDYFKSHARKVYARLQITAEDLKALAAVAWIRRHEGAATVRDLLTARVAGLKTATATRKLLRELVDRGYGQMIQEGKREVFTLAKEAK